MTLKKLLDLLVNIEKDADLSGAEIAVEGWDDNAFDGDTVVGVRVVTDANEKGETKDTAFIITEQGRRKNAG
jgi:hypothetical protein